MIIIETYGKEIISLIVPIITWLLNTLFKTRARILLSSPHAFIFLVQEPRFDSDGKRISDVQTVHTRSHIINNTGKEAATNIELVFNWKPLCINIWPPRHFDEYTENDKRYVMKFASLAPNEFLGFELLSINNELPNLMTVRSDQCIAQPIIMHPQPVIENWKRRVALLLLLAGFALTIYISIVLLQFLIIKTPFGH